MATPQNRKIIVVERDAGRMTDAISKIETHEKECTLRFKAIEERLERGSQRMDRMEMSVWGVYPFILATVFLAKYF